MRYLLLVTGWCFCIACRVACAGALAANSAPPPDPVYHFLDEPASGSYDLLTTVRAQGVGEARLCFAYRGPQDHCYARLTEHTLSLVRVREGKARELAPPYQLSTPLASQPATLLVKRRPERVSVVFRDYLLLSVADVDAGEGKVGVACAGGVQADAPKASPIEAPTFGDDFMRDAAEASPWENVAGQWSALAVGDVKKSANGFSYRGSGSPGFAVTGYPFWDDYVLQAGVKAAGPEGTVGLCLYFQDPKNHLALLWGSADGLRLVRVQDGASTELARRPMAWLPNQWYRLGVQARDGHLAAFVDGVLCLEAWDAAFARGKIALTVSGTDAFFDDVAVKPAGYFHDAAPLKRRERWLAAGGLLATGSLSWQDYTYRTRVRPAGGKPLSLAFAWRSPTEYYLFRWGEASKSSALPRQQILHVAGGERALLAEAPGGYQRGRSYAVAITCRPGYAAVAIDGERVLETADPLLTAGGVGFDPAGGALSDVTVTPYEEPVLPEEEITQEFTNIAAHPDMAEWANPARAWLPTPKAPGLFWRKGEYFGDTWMQAPVPPMGTGARLAVLLAADGQSPRSGYTVTAQRTEPGRVSVHLLRQTAAIPGAAGAISVPANQSGQMTVSRQGSYLIVDVDGKRLIKYRDVAPLGGTRLGIQVDGVNVDLKETHVRSRRTYDYTFHDSPTDWQAQAGVWEITNRWSCQPGWSWFGGKSEGLAVIWNKRRFAGDLVLEYYAAPKMDAVAEAYAQRFRDLNATICADGERLTSGYSFLIGGWRNSKTAILRGDRVVAETRSYTLPAQKVGHRQWFDVRIQKRGNRISLAVDNIPLLTYEDPDPLTGDRVALWTQNNGLMLARAVLSHEREKPLELLTRAPARIGKPPSAAAPAEAPTVALPLVNDFERDVEQWQGAGTRLAVDGTTAAQGKRSLAVVNAGADGEFRTVAVAGRFDAVQAGRIAFDYRVPPGVHLALYVRVGRAYYAIGFTAPGNANPPSGVLASLGKVPDVFSLEQAMALGTVPDVRADDTWRHAAFDLQGALRRFFPNTNPLMVEEVVLANWEPRDIREEGNDYILAGFLGNALGARYHLDHFVIGRPEMVAAAPERGPALASRGAAPRRTPLATAPAGQGRSRTPGAAARKAGVPTTALQTPTSASRTAQSAGANRLAAARPIQGNASAPPAAAPKPLPPAPAKTAGAPPQPAAAPAAGAPTAAASKSLPPKPGAPAAAAPARPAAPAAAKPTAQTDVAPKTAAAPAAAKPTAPAGAASKPASPAPAAAKPTAPAGAAPKTAAAPAAAKTTAPAGAASKPASPAPATRLAARASALLPNPASTAGAAPAGPAIRATVGPAKPRTLAAGPTAPALTGAQGAVVTPKQVAPAGAAPPPPAAPGTGKPGARGPPAPPRAARGDMARSGTRVATIGGIPGLGGAASAPGRPAVPVGPAVGTPPTPRTGSAPAVGTPASTPAPGAKARATGAGSRRTAALAPRSAAAGPNASPAPARPGGPRLALQDAFTPGKSAVVWDATEGKWAVNKAGQFAPTEKPEFAYAFAGDVNWTDYTLKADLIGGQDAGLCVRAQDWNNCVFLVIRPGHKDLWWFVRRDGQWGGILAPSALESGPKPLTRVKVVVSGDRFLCYIDGKRVSEMKDGTLRRGRIGVYIHAAEPGQAWDNVEVLVP